MWWRREESVSVGGWSGGGGVVGGEVVLELLRRLEILPVQMISLALAALRGAEAGRFALATKITAVE